MSQSSTPATDSLWRGEAATPLGDAEETGFARRLLVLLAAIGVALGALVGAAAWFRPHPYPVLWPLFDDGGPPDKPSIGQVSQDAASIRAGRWFSRTINPVGETGRPGGRIPSPLPPPGMRSDETLVAVLCSPSRIGLRAGSGEAEVFVMPGEGSGGSAGWLPMRELLESLARSRARRVLLLVDVMRPMVDPARGQLADDATARLRADLSALVPPGSSGRLAVFCAAGVGQVSWASEVWGRSVFLAYAEEGLNGWADLDPVAGNRDHRVTLDELVRYVVPRVDRWAVRCRGVRQTPVLLGSRDPFPITHRPRGPITGRAAPPEDRAYPGWLEEGWALRDRWKSGSAVRLAPWSLRRLEEQLLLAESSWRGGADPERVRAELAARQAALAREFEAERSFPHPVPRSLALAGALGEPPDDRIALALTKLLRDRADPGVGLKPDELAAARARALAEFQKVAEGSGDFALARAVFQAAAAAPRPSPGDLQFLDGLLAGRQPEPRYVETWLLRRLAVLGRSTSAGAWSPDAARLALSSARLGERAQALPRSFAPVRPWLEAAARERHLGEVALFAPGFAPADEPGRRLRHAVEIHDSVAGAQAVIERARDLRDQALAILPAALGTVEADRSLDASWEGAARATIDLDERLAARAASPGAIPEEAPVGDLLRLVAPIRDRMDDLERRLGPFEAMSSSGAVADLIAQAHPTQGDAATWRRIDNLLAMPWPAAKDRAALWAAGRDLERRLLEPILASEPEAADRRDSAAISGPDEPGASLPAEEAARRAARSIAMLRMAGQDPERLAALESERERVRRTGADWAKLGEMLRLAWLEPLTASSEEADRLRRDRMARVVPLEFAAILLGRWSRDPVAERRDREWTALRAWLADVMLYRARDLGGLPFDAEAARDYNPPGHAPGVPQVRLIADPPTVTLTPRGPSATVRIQIAERSGEGPIGLRFLAPADGLPRIRPDLAHLEGATQEPPGPGWAVTLRPASRSEPGPSLPLRLERPSEIRPLDPAPLGILVQYQVGGWPFTRELPVALPADPEPFRVIVSDDPDQPADRLLVRPGIGPRPLPMRVHNPTASRRSVVVELRAGEGAAPVLSPSLAVDAGAEQPVSFGQGPLPQGKLPALSGSLRLRVLDADRPGIVLGDQEVIAGVRPSASYVQVEEVRYDSPRGVAGEPNRLVVRLRSRAIGAGPPCPVELVLAPGRIPGFLSAESGRYRGALTPDGKETTLFAEGLRFAESADSSGTVALNIDGVPHAQTFLLRFARAVGTTLGERTLTTSLKLRAPDAVRGGDPLVLVAEVDNAPEDATLELGLGRADRGPFEPLVSRMLDAPREARIGFVAIGPGGTPHVEATLGDWSIDVPTAGIQGSFQARARLRDAEGREIATASRSVIIDDTPPRWVRLARLPKQARRGAALEVRAAGQVPASGIREVVFFVGKPTPDGKLPPNAPTATGTPLPGAPDYWSAKLPLPPELKGPIEVSATITSNVGLGRSDTGRIELIDTDPVPTGSIRGVVREGALPQAGLAVALVNARGEKQLETRTGDDGVFSFNEVPVGKYTIASYKPTSMRIGRQPVEVQADRTSQVRVELLYQ